MNFPSYDDFKKWLGSKNPNDVVGVSCDNCHCPIATFLQENGFKEAKVTPARDHKFSFYEYKDKTSKTGCSYDNLEAWANLTARKVDSYFSKNKRITSDDMLKILDKPFYESRVS